MPTQKLDLQIYKIVKKILIKYLLKKRKEGGGGYHF